MRGRVASAAAVLAWCLAGAACTAAEPTLAALPTAPVSATGAPAAVDLLPQERVDEDMTMRVADSVAPPSNRWYSSLAFGQGGLPVFPRPLAVTPVDGGVGVGLTQPQASAAAILAPARTDLTMTVEGASGLGVVTAADPVGVTLDLGPAQVVLAQGWPVAGLVASEDVAVTFSVALSMESERLAVATIEGRSYGVVIEDGAWEVSEATDATASAAQLRVGGSLQAFAVPEGSSASALAGALTRPVTDVTWAAATIGDEVETTLDYGVDTVLTVPADRAVEAGLDCSLGTYATIDGTFAVCAAREYAWKVDALAPSAQLDVAELTESERSTIRAALIDDVATTPDLPADSYFGGKALYRLANLRVLAEDLGEDEAANDLDALLAEHLRLWGDAARCDSEDARCFVYDPVLRSVVGRTPAFGSDELNDHHFHYGYLLYAAAVAGARDPALLADIRDVFDLVAADIAGGEQGVDAAGAALPPIRHMDIAAGHSWASGYSPFADGNNQESSSEAVAAWNAVALWGEVTGDQALATRGRWLLALEADAARRLWLAPDLEQFPEFEHPIVSLQWGAKRDYATWFSAEPGAMLGIEIIPASPAMAQYFASVPAERIEAAVAEGLAAGTSVAFADYMLMYSAAAGPQEAEQAWHAALELPATAIDDGNSRAYLLAWIASHTR
ncbi:glycosyl hydrolase [Demequina globuliformis]|uniref:glycosyl hydrolase n=1 Tax=Demequina globuliformis TaxID=676202 RepID=UPI0007822DA4|nr:glycosyl hydrolase [Demequina globuliformis]